MKEIANIEDFYIVTYEAGAEQTPVPTWASETPNALGLHASGMGRVKRHEIERVPGAFWLEDVLSKQECDHLIGISERLGYTQDASVSLPRSVRHNENLVWVIDDLSHDLLWRRCQDHIIGNTAIYADHKPLGLNQRCRFYKYSQGDFFKPHTDGSWPGSKVINKKLIRDAFRDRMSQMSFLILLSEGYEGGATQFFVDKDHPSKPARSLQASQRIDVVTPKGSVLCFPHGTHPLHCLHASQELIKGTKYIIRTDVLFNL